MNVLLMCLASSKEDVNENKNKNRNYNSRLICRKTLKSKHGDLFL